MRRRRSNTIEAGSYEEFMRVSLGEDFQNKDKLQQTSELHESSSLQNDSEYNQTDSPNQGIAPISNNPPFSQVGSKKNVNYWDDIDFQAGTSPDGKSFSEDDSTFYSLRSKSEEDHTLASFKGQEGETLTNTSVTKHKKVMVIGGKRTGRHTLIDSLFEKNAKEDLKDRSCLDLMIKKHQVKEETNVIKFWIKDAQDKNFDQLIRIHYKTIKFYIFTYKTTDRKSFECLEEAIEKAKAEVPPEDFCGILVGNARHSQSFLTNIFSPKKKKREVTSEEGESLGKKYGLLQFIEANLNSNNWKQEILNFLLSEKKN